jgi:hypothetical protein
VGCQNSIKERSPAAYSQDALYAPPIIRVQPQSQIVKIHDNLTLTVIVENPPLVAGSPITFQWRKNGVDIPGATSSNLTILNIQTNSATEIYNVTVDNSHGSKSSDNAGAIPETDDPTGNSGTLTVGVGLFGSNSGSESCFPTAQGWDRSFLIPGLFHRFASGAGLPGSDTYPNPSNLATLQIDTCDPSNGTVLQTGIAVLDDFFPTDKLCATTSTCGVSSLLTINSRTMNPRTSPAMARYKATVFYKNATSGGISTITVHWAYQ